MKQLKNIKFILCPLLALCMHSVNAQFITVKGKQFYDQSGNPFYPLVCNFGIGLYCSSCTGSGSYPEDGGNTGGEFDPADVDVCMAYNDLDVPMPFGNGLGYIKAGFAKVKAMGFNTVRLIGWSPNLNLLNPVCSSPRDASFCSQYNNLSASIACESIGYPITYTTPYSSDYNLNNVVMPKIKQVMQAANDAGLYVILDCLYIGDFSGSDAQADAVNNMLTAIAASIASDVSGHPELLAYDLYNEPHDHISSGRNTSVKNKICQYTAIWYSNIKAADPNHLITNGDTDPSDVMDWDPAVLKLDFNCYHPYPYFYVQSYDGYNEANAMSRYQTMLYWLTNNTPMPWIIAETGVEACCTSSTGYNPALIDWCSLADESAWALQSQQITVNSGSSGYGWWDFSEPEVGLLFPGHPTIHVGSTYTYDNSYDKPIVAGAFGSNTVTHGTAQITQPANYYTAFNPPGYSFFTWSGIVQDQDGNPIQDAVIQGSNTKNHGGDNLHPFSGADKPKVPADAGFSITTFSKADGSFSLIAPVQSPSSILTSSPYNDYDYGKFDHIAISAPGASVFHWDVDNLSQSGAPTATTITLDRRPGVFDNPVFELDINSSNSTSTTSPYIVTARHALITGGDVVEPTGFADFHASSMVDVWGATGLSVPGLAAEEGSYTHIYCLPVDFDCSQLLSPDYIHMNPTLTPQNNNSVSAEEEKDITVNYSLPANNIRLMPNPAENYFYLSVPGDSPVGTVEITDALGNNVFAGKIPMDGQTPFNTSTFAPGFYNVHVINNTYNQNFKLIISR